MEQLSYKPPMMFSLFPAPGPLLGLGRPAEGLLSVSMFEPNEATLEQAATPRSGRSSRSSRPEPSAEGLPYTVFETQATASWNAWEILVPGVEAAGRP